MRGSTAAIRASSASSASVAETSPERSFCWSSAIERDGKFIRGTCRTEARSLDYLRDDEKLARLPGRIGKSSFGRKGRARFVGAEDVVDLRGMRRRLDTGDIHLLQLLNIFEHLR